MELEEANTVLCEIDGRDICWEASNPVKVILL